MVVNTIRVKLYAPWVHSLKEKRMVVRSLCERLRNKYNISVIESEAQDVHQTIILAIAFLAGNNALADSTSEGICDFIETSTDAEIVDIQVEQI